MKFGYDIGAWFYLTIRKNIFDNSDSKIKESSRLDSNRNRTGIAKNIRGSKCTHYNDK